MATMKARKDGLVGKVRPASVVVAAGFLFAPTVGWAFEAKDLMAFSVGPFVLRPKLTVSETYNDNIFYDVQDEESAFITGVTPALEVRLGRIDADRVFRLGYNFNQYWYHGTEDIDTAQAHNVTLSGTIKGDRLSSDTAFFLGFMNTIYGGYEAFGQGASLVSRNIDRFSWGLNQALQYRFGERTSVHGRFTLNDLDFQQEGAYYDQMTWKILGGVGYAIRPKVQGLAEVYYGQTASDPNLSLTPGLPPSLWVYTFEPDKLETVGGYAGARLTFTTKLTGTVKVGYEQSHRGEWAGSEAIEVGAPVGNIALTSAFTQRTSATLSYDRSTGTSVQATAGVYTGDRFSLQLRQVLGTTHPWIITAGGTYGLNQYDERRTPLGIVTYPDYKSDFIGANVGLAYQPQPWLGAALNYRFSHRTTDSAGSTVDYTVNEVTLAVSVGY